ncbi:MAG: hypothetical protein ACI8V5_004396 [Limisphaerales bacterium]|jgi:hypothetical protein
MRKTFSLSDPKHAPARVVEAIKSDIRKYLKRERRKKLPEGIAHWSFDCRSGKEESEAKPTHPAELPKAVDTAAAEDWPAIYIEILAKPDRPSSKPPTPKSETAAPESIRPATDEAPRQRNAMKQTLLISMATAAVIRAGLIRKCR